MTNMLEFIRGVLSQGGDVDCKNMDSPFRPLMKKYTCYNHTLLKQKFPDLDIIKIKYQIKISSQEDNYETEYEDGNICIALPKDIEGNIEDINPTEIYITSTSEKLNCSYEWTIKSIKLM